MSTRNTDVEKEQSASQGPPGTIFNEDTLQLGRVSPPPTAPQPPKHTDNNGRNFWLAIAAVVIVLALIFSVFAIFIAQPGKQTGTQPTPGTTPGTTVTTTPGNDTTPAPSPGVTHGPQNGPPPVNTTAYWDTILGTKGTNSKVESVSFANVMGNPSLQALVTVRHSDANKTLDVYVFNNITSKSPTQIFKLEGLIKGEAKMSYYNSIMTAQVNPNSTLNTGKSVSQMTPDIFQEYAWVNGTMTQVAFPGIFPDMTRYQAEADQTSVNAGHDPWKLDAAAVAKALEVKFFNWQRTVTTKVLSGGGPNNVSATVQVQEAPIQNAHPTIVVTLSRLEGNTHNMWVAIGVTDSSTLTLKNITARQTISSPVTLEGTGAAFESQVGQAVVYDQAYASIGHTTVHANTSAGIGSYTTKVSYTSSFHGVQEGMVAVYQDMGGLSAENETAVMVKVLVNPTPSTSIRDPAYWTQFVTAPPAIRVADSVRFGHLLGNNSLQAVVVARDILGGGPVYRDVFVFDNITASHPHLLWHESRLLHGDAKISGYNTIMTSQVEANSSINTGKSEGALTNDLFREFKWSDGAGTFVQTAFPGFFPDMTRWQAEAAQAQVNAGQNAWRNDPVVVAKLLAAQLMNWQGTVTTKVLSGGGPNDVSATIQVQGTPIQSAQPTIVVTLSRLEGNTHNIWEAIGVKDRSTLTLTNIPQGTLISSPAALTGTGSAFEGVIGQGVVYDHLFTNIGHAQLTGSPGMGIANYSIQMPYSSSFKGGAQEGIVVAYQDMGGLSSGYSSAVVVKVMIGG
jgi:hypothetical protein